jgi:hypothetical protein
VRTRLLRSLACISVAIVLAVLVRQNIQIAGLEHSAKDATHFLGCFNDKGISQPCRFGVLHANANEVRVGSSGAACSTANAGALRYANERLQYCNGANWLFVN